MRWLWAIPAVLFGALVGLEALVVHRDAVWVGAVPLPWGALLAIAAPTAVGIALRNEPALLLGFLAGWLLILLRALGGGAGGDFVLMNDVVGWGFLGANLLVFGVVMFAVGATRRTRTGTGRV
jgi:hypothetical protein